MVQAVLTSTGASAAPSPWCPAGLPAAPETTGRRADFLHWRGASGRRYAFSVFRCAGRGEPDDAVCYEDCVVLLVSRAAEGGRRILLAVDTGPLPGLVFAGAAFRKAFRGADEVHLHLLAETGAERGAVIADLLGG